MAKAGDELVSPVFERIVFRKTTGDTGGELVEVDVYYAPGGDFPPEHYHPHQEERFEVLSGNLSTRIGESERTYGSGQSFTIPAGTPHTMCNRGNEEAHVIWQTRPALKTEVFFETVWGLSRDNIIANKGIPNLFQAAVLFLEYSNEFVLTRPPLIMQRILFGVLAPIGKLLGYRGRYPRYSGTN